MFKLGSWEVVVILIVALVLIRPQDLPRLIRKAGEFIAQLRGLKASITDSMSEIEREIAAPVSLDGPGEAERTEPSDGGEGEGPAPPDQDGGESLIG